VSKEIRFEAELSYNLTSQNSGDLLMLDRITVPSCLLHPSGGEHYVLRVVGGNTEEENISHGDYLIILRCETPLDGEMVIAQIGDTTTIKRYFLDEGKVRLQHCCQSKPPIFVNPSDVKISGIVVGLMRKF
jgi:repressor LexA